MRRASFLVSFLWVIGCGGAAPGADEPRSEVIPVAEETPPPLSPQTEGTIGRAELDEILAGGFGRFLQRVTTEPHLEDGRFVGFRLTELRTELFAGLDLQRGDTLLSINGLPIERPEEALQAWNGLRVASELTVEYLRAGEQRQLRFAIAD